MKKILQISNYFYPHIGGIEQVTRDIIRVISNMENYEQKVICFNEDAEDEDYVCNRKETIHDMIDGIEVVRCGCIMKKASQSISLTFPGELRKIMDDFSPDIIIFHYPNPFQAEFFQTYFHRKFKMILYWHLDITKQKILGKLFHSQSIRLLKRADKIVATSPNYIDGSPYLSEYRNKCVVIPNCVDISRLKITDNVQTRVNAIRKENEGKVICFAIGRHVPYKGFTYLIQTSKILDDRFRFFIGGYGPLSNSLENEAKGDPKIRFLGKIDDDELVAWYLAMDIFCFPSITKNEAFGISLAESMYFEKPAVTFTITGSGVNFVALNTKTCIECENCNIREFANAIVLLSENKKLREHMGKSAKKRVDSLFLFNSFYDKLSEIIKDLN